MIDDQLIDEVLELLNKPDWRSVGNVAYTPKFVSSLIIDLYAQSFKEKSMNKVWEPAIAALLNNQPELAMTFIQQGMKELNDEGEFKLEPTPPVEVNSTTEFLHFDHWQVS